MQGLVDLVRKDYFPAGPKATKPNLGGVQQINQNSYIYRNG
jgi:hypothetical protein